MFECTERFIDFVAQFIFPGLIGFSIGVFVSNFLFRFSRVSKGGNQ